MKRCIPALDLFFLIIQQNQIAVGGVPDIKAFREMSTTPSARNGVTYPKAWSVANIPTFSSMSSEGKSRGAGQRLT